MKAQIEIEVRNEHEASLLELALKEPDITAFVLIIGALLPLSRRARVRVLRYTQDHCEECAELELTRRGSTTEGTEEDGGGGKSEG